MRPASCSQLSRDKIHHYTPSAIANILYDRILTHVFPHIYVEHTYMWGKCVLVAIYIYGQSVDYTWGGSISRGHTKQTHIAGSILQTPPPPITAFAVCHGIAKMWSMRGFMVLVRLLPDVVILIIHTSPSDGANVSTHRHVHFALRLNDESPRALNILLKINMWLIHHHPANTQFE